MTGRGRLSRRTGAPHLAPITAALAVLAVLAAVWWARGPDHSTVSAAPEKQIEEALGRQTRATLPDVYGFQAGGTLELDPVRYHEAVSFVNGERATVVAMLDAEGRVSWKDGAAKLSYIGRERFHMAPCALALWCAEGDQFARLRGVLALLFRRQDAFNRRDPEGYAPLLSARYLDQDVTREALLRRLARDLLAGPGRERVLGWQIRVERETAEVGEDFELTAGAGPPRQLRARYALRWEGERWLFSSGL
jgi:hypothetical protein